MDENIEEVVQEFIKPYVVQKYLKSNVDTAHFEEVKKYAELSGFTNHASDQLGKISEEIANRVLYTAMQKLNLSIVLKCPQFATIEDIDTEAYRFYLRTKNVRKALQLPSKKHQITVKDWLGRQRTETVETPQFLVEVNPENYIGKIPESVIVIAGKAVEANLIPKVWIAGTEQEIRNSVNQQVDPLVVGYPVIRKDKKGNKTWYTTHCLLLAAWGKDLELIDQYFAHGR